MTDYYKDLIKNKNLHKMLPFAYFNKEVIPLEKAVISIAANSLQYGNLVFGGIKGYFRNGKIQVFRLEDHYYRLLNACKILGFDYFIEKNNFFDIFAKIIKANSPTTDVYFRPFIFCDQMVISPKKHSEMEFDMAIYMLNMGNYMADKPLNLKISSFTKYNDKAISTKAKAGGAYINSFLATNEATSLGYDDALLLDDNGFLAEASVANVLGLIRGEVVTPFIGGAALDGITLRTVKELLHLNGYKVKEMPIDRSMIYTMDELLITGTAVQVREVASVDGRLIGRHKNTEEFKNGIITSLLKKEFTKVLDGEHEKSSDWLTPFAI